MNDIILNGETLEISRVVDSIEIEGFDHTFSDGKAESKLVVASGGSSPGPISPYYTVNRINNFVNRNNIPESNIVTAEIVILPDISEVYTTGYNAVGSITTDEITNVHAGETVVLFISHRASITLTNSNFQLLKTLGISDSSQTNSIYVFTATSDLASVSTTINQNGSARMGYYMFKTNFSVQNDTSCDYGANNVTAADFSNPNGFENFILFYSCVYSGGNAIIDQTNTTVDCDTQNEHRMKVFKMIPGSIGTSCSLSNAGSSLITLGVRLIGGS